MIKSEKLFVIGVAAVAPSSSSCCWFSGAGASLVGLHLRFV